MKSDQLEIFHLKEDPDRWEALINTETELARTDPAARAVVESMYWETDRALAFQRYLDSLDFKHLLHILKIFKVSFKKPLCEIGGGSGQLSWALSQSGFQDVTLLEPNPRWITGTGYLQTVASGAAGQLTLSNDLDAWYASPAKYPAVITRNCVHHFKNISMTAAAIRQKLAKGGLWFMVREWFADSPGELYRKLGEHPYCQKYKVYEFPFPAAHYIEATQMAGFRMVAVVPAGYANNSLSEYVNDEGPPSTRRYTRTMTSLLKRHPWITRRLYGMEYFLNRYLGAKFQRFTRPQVIIFRREEID